MAKSATLILFVSIFAFHSHSVSFAQNHSIVDQETFALKTLADQAVALSALIRNTGQQPDIEKRATVMREMARRLVDYPLRLGPSEFSAILSNCREYIPADWFYDFLLSYVVFAVPSETQYAQIVGAFNAHLPGEFTNLSKESIKSLGDLAKTASMTQFDFDIRFKKIQNRGPRFLSWWAKRILGTFRFTAGSPLPVYDNQSSDKRAELLKLASRDRCLSDFFSSLDVLRVSPDFRNEYAKLLADFPGAKMRVSIQARIEGDFDFPELNLSEHRVRFELYRPGEKEPFAMSESREDLEIPQETDDNFFEDCKADTSRIYRFFVASRASTLRPKGQFKSIR